MNINVLDYESNKKGHHFLKGKFQYNMIPTINKLTRVTKITTTAIDHIITNAVIESMKHRSGIKKIDVSDCFQLTLRLTHVTKVSQKITQNLFINASMEKNKDSYSSMNQSCRKMKV